MSTDQVSSVTVVTFSAASAWLVSRRFPVQETAVRWLAFLLLWAGLLILPVQAAGSLQLAGAIPRFTMFGLALTQVVLFVLATLAIRRIPVPALSASEGAIRLSAPLPLYIKITAAVLALSYGMFAVDLLSSYPSGNDALGYHYLKSLRLLQNGSFWLHSGAFQFNLPANVEIGMMPFLATGIQCLAPVFNWLGIAVLGLSVYLIALRLWNHQEAAIVVVLLLLSFPIAQFQAFSGYVDVTGTGFLFAAVALWLFRYKAEREDTSHEASLGVLVLTGLAAGLSVGSKTTFYFYNFFLVAFMLSELAWSRQRNKTRFAAPVLVLLAGLLLPSVFWIGKGLLAAGNPVYPLQVKIGSSVVFKGVSTNDVVPKDAPSHNVEQNWEWMFYPWTEYKRAPGFLLIPYSTGDGFGAAFATFVPLGVLFLGYDSFRRKRWLELALLLFWLLLLASWWLIMNRLLRFGIPIWVLSFLLTVPLLARAAEASRRWFRPLVVFSVAATCMVSSFIPFHSLMGRIRSGEWSREEYYGYPKAIDTLPAGSVVLNATAFSTLNFPLAGRNLSNRVITDM
ncbi:MAG: hypothetical protein AB7O65_13535, partial [Candidatus Korobacteraceae bacterium]